MTKQPHPHRLRVLSIKSGFLLIALAALLAVWLSGCSPQKNGCRATRGMAGYSWIKCKETGKVAVFGPNSKLICIYKEKTK